MFHTPAHHQAAPAAAPAQFEPQLPLAYTPSDDGIEAREMTEEDALAFVERFYFNQIG